jgi:hypothetical protein
MLHLTSGRTNFSPAVPTDDLSSKSREELEAMVQQLRSEKKGGAQ